MGALDGTSQITRGQDAQAGQTPWTPNYSDVASSVARSSQSNEVFIDYFDVMGQPNYAQSVLSGAGLIAQRIPVNQQDGAQMRHQRRQQNPTLAQNGLENPGDTTQQTQQSGGVQWRQHYGSDIGTTFRPGQPTNSTGAQWRQNYQQDVGNNFVVGQQSNNDGSQSAQNATQDVGIKQVSNRQQDVGSQQASSGASQDSGGLLGSNDSVGATGGGGGQWRAVYGQDVGTTFQPGQPTQSTTPYRATPGSDIGTTYQPGGQPSGSTGDGTGYNPNANGNGSSQSSWLQRAQQKQMPQMQVPSMGQPGRSSTPGDHSLGTPGAQQSGSGTGSFWQQQNAKIMAVDKQLRPNDISTLGVFIAGGVGGLFGGQVLPRLGDFASNSILAKPVADAPPGGTLSGWAEKLPKGGQKAVKPAVDNIEAGMARIGEAVAGPEGGLRERAAQAWRDNFNPKTKVAQNLKLQRADSEDRLARLDLDVKAAEAEQAEFIANNAGKVKKGEELYEQAVDLSKAVSAAKADYALEEQKLLGLRAGSAGKDIMRTATAPIVADFARGAAAAGLGMVVDNYLDRGIEGHDHKYGLSFTTALTIPTALALGKNTWPSRIAWGLGAGIAGHFAGKALDSMMPESDGFSLGTALRPNGIDAFNIGAAAALPTNNWRTKAALVGTGWAIGRMANSDFLPAAGWAAGAGIAGFALAPNPEMKAAVVGLDVLGLGLAQIEHSFYPGDAVAEQNDTAWSTAKKDFSTRTAGSMEHSIKEMSTFGVQSQGALEYYFNNWCHKVTNFPDKVTAYRGATILSAALGQSRLESGPVTERDKAGNPIKFLPGFAGMNLDLGGQAMKSLLISQNTVMMAEKYTQANLGKTINGKEVTQSEVDDLDKIKQEVAGTISDKICGQHDIDKAYDLWSDYYSKGLEMGAAGKFLEATKRSIVANMSQPNYNAQFVAKLCRDEALMLMGAAKFHIKGNDGGGVQTLLYGDPNPNSQIPDGADALLRTAQQLDPNNPDLPELNKILGQLESQVPAAIQAQKSNPHYNPLNVDNALPPVQGNMPTKW